MVRGRRVNRVWLESSPHFISDFVDDKAPILKTGPSQALAPDVFYYKKTGVHDHANIQSPRGLELGLAGCKERLPCHKAPIQCMIHAMLFLSI